MDLFFHTIHAREYAYNDLVDVTDNENLVWETRITNKECNYFIDFCFLF